MKDRYKEIKTTNFPGMVIRVHIPDLTRDERAARMKAIRKAAENLLRKDG